MKENYAFSSRVDDIGGKVTNARAIVELSLDHIDGGEDLRTAVSALYGALSILEATEQQAESLASDLMKARALAAGKEA